MRCCTAACCMRVWRALTRLTTRACRRSSRSPAIDGADRGLQVSERASLRTMPRAPICRASMICWVVMSEVSRMILTVGVPFAMARMAFKAGQARHLYIEQQDVGLGSSRVWVIASSPSGGLAYNFKTGVGREHIAHADAYYWVIICEHDPGSNGRPCGSFCSFHLSPNPPRRRPILASGDFATRFQCRELCITTVTHSKEFPSTYSVRSVIATVRFALSQGGY